MRLADLAAELGRTVEGDAEFRIAGVAALDGAGPRDLAYVRSEKLARALAASRAGALIAPPGVDAGGRPVIRSPHPSLDFARAVRRLVASVRPAPGVHASAWIDPGARVDASASIGPGCALGSGASVGPRSVLHANVTLYDAVVVGADCELHAGCVLRERTQLGDRVVLQPGVVLGGDGFGYVITDAGALEAMPHLGRVVVADDVEIGANSAVDRGTFGDTRIERGAKLDNLVQVGHNVVIGESALVVAQAGLAGSSRIGRSAVIMSQAGIPDHATIGARAYVGPKSGVHGDVAEDARVMGYPHRDMRAFQRIFAALGLLPALIARVRALERKPAAAAPAKRARAGKQLVARAGKQLVGRAGKKLTARADKKLRPRRRGGASR